MSHAATDLRSESRRDLDGKRLGAFLIDLALLSPLALVMIAVLVPRYGAGLGVFGLISALQLAYFHLSEVTTGQTVGKRVVGLRVVSLDGGLPSRRQAATRAVLRLIDETFIGPLVLVASGGRRQRLGDLAAGTAVVRADAHPVAARPLTRAAFAYPLMWLVPAVVSFGLWTSGQLPGTYRDTVDQICAEEIAALGPRPDIASIMMGSARLMNEFATLSVPGNWRTRHDALTRAASLEYTLAHQVVRSYRQGDMAAARDQYGRLAALSRTNNARLAQLGYHGCAGETT